ncbi:MAG: FtsQ-type POTRA domain-containing protein [Acidobacteria bacterium]|nr:FtsQ-type POTRA domain-containing protein [Acidobacteriota bacterium]
MTMREDPRLRRRRIDVSRSVGRRRLRRLMILMLATGVFLFVLFGLRSPAFDIDHVEVSGSVRIEEAELVALSGIELGDPLIDLDAAAARHAIEQLPYVESVSVRREWPNKALIDVVEREPLYEIISGGRFAVVSADGVVVEVVDEPSGLPAVLAGAEAVSLKVGDHFGSAEGVSTVIRAIGPNLSRWIDRVETDDRRGLVLNLVGSAEAVLGSAADVDKKLIGLATVLGRAELSCIDEIDVRVADSPIVRRGCT